MPMSLLGKCPPPKNHKIEAVYVCDLRFVFVGRVLLRGPGCSCGACSFSLREAVIRRRLS